MDDRIKESVSALLDDEANELEIQRLLSQVDDEELSLQVKRYQLTKNVMQQGGTFAQIDVSAAVSKAIADDLDEVSEPNSSSRVVDEKVSKGKAFGGMFAVAASMVFAITFVVNNVETEYGQVGSDIASLNSNEKQQITHELANVAARQPVYVDNYSDEQAKRLNQYLLRHAEHSMLGARQGAMPLVRVASYNSVGI